MIFAILSSIYVIGFFLLSALYKMHMSGYYIWSKRYWRKEESRKNTLSLEEEFQKNIQDITEFWYLMRIVLYQIIIIHLCITTNILRNRQNIIISWRMKKESNMWEKTSQLIMPLIVLSHLRKLYMVVLKLKSTTFNEVNKLMNNLHLTAAGKT